MSAAKRMFCDANPTGHSDAELECMSERHDEFNRAWVTCKEAVDAEVEAWRAESMAMPGAEGLSGDHPIVLRFLIANLKASLIAERVEHGKAREHLELLAPTPGERAN